MSATLEASLPTTRRIWPRAALALAALFVVVVGSFAVLAHASLQTRGTDLGQITQALWSGAHGDLLLTVTTSEGQQSYLAVHQSLILYLLLPLVVVGEWIGSPGAVLCLLNVVAVAGAALALGGLAARRSGSPVFAVAVMGIVLMSPIAHDAALFDFKPFVLGVALLAAGLYALERGRWPRALVLFTLAALSKEDLPLSVAAVGLLELSRDRRRGLTLVVVGVTLFGAMWGLGALVRADSPGPELHGRYAWLGDKTGSGLPVALGAPELVLRHLLAPEHVRLPLYLLAAGGLWALRAPRWLVLAAPSLAVPWLAVSDGWTTRVTGAYYAFGPFILIAAAVVYAWTTEGQIRPGGRRVVVAWGGTTVLLCALLSPLPPGAFSSFAHYMPGPTAAALDEVAEIVPEGAPLCVQSNLLPHFATRARLSRAPKLCRGEEWLLVALTAPGGPDVGLFPRTAPYTLVPRGLASVVRGLLHHPGYHLVERRAGLWLFGPAEAGRRATTQDRAALERDIALLKAAMRQMASARRGFAEALAGPNNPALRLEDLERYYPPPPDPSAAR